MEAFRPLEEFKRDVDDFIAYLKATPAAEGHDEVLHPGELERRRAEQRRGDGVPVDDRTLEALADLARRLGAGAVIGHGDRGEAG